MIGSEYTVRTLLFFRSKGFLKNFNRSLKWTLLSAIILLHGCRPETKPNNSSLSSRPSYNDTFIESSIGDAIYLNPVLSSDSASSDINGLVFNGLVKYNENLELVPDLARKWIISNNGLRFTFYLKKNVRWHDGKRFTAKDVLYTYNRLVDPLVKTPRSSDFERVEFVRIINNFAIEINYIEPFVPALESWGIGIIPQHVFDGAEGKDFNEHPANKKPIGTGPYKFKQWKVDEKIVLETNPSYFEGKPRIAKYIYRIIPDQAVEFLELRNRSIDSMGLTPDQYYAYEEFFEEYNKFRMPRAAYTYMGFNLKRPLFKSLTVRKALAHAINKDDLVQGVLLGTGRQATGPFMPLSWAFNPLIRDYKYNPNYALTLLKRAGWKDSNGDGILDKNGKDFEFTIVTNQGNKLRSLTAEIIQHQLKKLGIKVHIRIIEWSTFINNFINKKNFDAVILGWSLSPDPDQFSIWHSSQKKEGEYNFISYKNIQVDRILVQGRKEFNFKKRKRLYREMHQLIHKDIPYIFLYYPEALPVVHKRFKGIKDKVPLASFGLAWNFDKWYVPENQVKYPIITQ